HQAHTQPAAPVSKPRARAGLRFGGTARGEVQMRGLMMGMPLPVSDLIRHADRHHGTTEIVSRRVEGDLYRYTYRDAHARARQLANALRTLGCKPGDRVASLAWNGYRHFELYYAVAGSGMVMHTVNPRLFPEQIAWILNDAEPGLLFIDLTF